MNMASTTRFCRILRQIPKLNRQYSSASDKFVDVQLNDDTGVATVTMQRPPVNGLNLELLQQLSSALDKLEGSKCNGMILTSSSPTVFSAGLDITEMYKPKPDRVKAFWSTLQDTWLKLYGSSFPTAAAINGHSPAGGCLLALSCEYRVMVGPKFTIGLNETQLGIVAPKWFQDSMRGVIAPRQAEMALTLGRMFSTAEAKEIGLVDEVVADKAQAITKAEEFLDKFSSVPHAARKLTKLSFRREPLEWLQKNKEADLNMFLNFVNQPKVQMGLELYMASLKNK
ncbi:hypothetical protein J437_LFUL015763 [Ladona fulva]|uniref:Enoyl-CoA delta isomerase 1, mitochondrial n=1 Tax=Ladona fulva TaxID=123851 RepID=A0A8K0KL23_LADFU|nr:hypothetical protein J437_LFUL015763 [Ladona fulva]